MRVALFALVFLALLVLASSFVGSAQYHYYWFGVGAYFVYDVRVEGVSQGTIYLGGYRGHPSGAIHVRVDFSKFKLVWRIVDVRGEWAVVELSFVFSRARNLNTSEVLDFKISYLFEVNTRTLQAYLVDGVRVWAREWPFLIRPEQLANNSVKMFLSPKWGPVIGVDCNYDWYRERIEPVLREVNETIVRLTNGSRNINFYVKVRGVVKVGDRETISFLIVNPEAIREGRALGLSLTFIAINLPPSPRDYSYGNITLTRDRLALGFSSDLLVNRRIAASRELYGGVPEIAGLYNITIKLGEHPNMVVYNYTLVVDRWGALYVVLPDFPVRVHEALYDSISGVLVYAKLSANPNEFVKFFGFNYGNFTVDLPLGIRPERVIELYLSDTNIPLERPVIGGRPGVEATPTPPAASPTRGVEVPATGARPSPVESRPSVDLWRLLVLAVIVFSLAAILLVSLRFLRR